MQWPEDAPRIPFEKQIAETASPSQARVLPTTTESLGLGSDIATQDISMSHEEQAKAETRPDDVEPAAEVSELANSQPDSGAANAGKDRNDNQAASGNDTPLSSADVSSIFDTGISLIHPSRTFTHTISLQTSSKSPLSKGLLSFKVSHVIQMPIKNHCITWGGQRSIEEHVECWGFMRGDCLQKALQKLQRHPKASGVTGCRIY